MTNAKKLRPYSVNPQKWGKNERIDREVKDLRNAGIAPDETHSQDADRHRKATHQKEG